jgi:hypothetical protein
VIARDDVDREARGGESAQRGKQLVMAARDPLELGERDAIASLGDRWCVPIELDLQEIEQVAKDYQPPAAPFLCRPPLEVAEEPRERRVVEEVFASAVGAGPFVVAG